MDCCSTQVRVRRDVTLRDEDDVADVDKVVVVAASWNWALKFLFRIFAGFSMTLSGALADVTGESVLNLEFRRDRERRWWDLDEVEYKNSQISN